MIKKLVIRNFRSIKSAEIELGAIDAFVGPNNAGKSNIMRALNLLLGATYPSARSFEEGDFFQYDKSNPITLAAFFDAPLTSNPRVWGFCLTFNGADCDYVAVDQNGNTLTYSSYGREIRVSNEMKDEVALMYLGLDREASEQVRATQWTLYGRLLRHIDKQMDPSKKAKFKKDIQSAYDLNIAADIKPLEDLLGDHVKKQTGMNLHLRMKMLDPIETLKNLRPYLNDGSSTIDFDAEDMGAGTQSALAVAIARAYGDIVKQPLVLAIEEPELYLHPHGCRNFYKMLTDLSKSGVQVIYTTHERCFVDISKFQSIHLVRKSAGETKVQSATKTPPTLPSQVSAAAKFDESVNEVFFANHAVLVEGPADKIACRAAMEKLGLDLDKECVSIVECGSNTGVRPIADVLRVFGIPSYALVDEDPGNLTTAGIVFDLRKSMGADRIFLQSPKLEGMFGLTKKPSKAEAIRFFSPWFQKNNPPPVYAGLKQKIKP